MGERRAEDAHHRVADELLDDASERLDLAAHAVVVGRQDCTNVLGIEPFGSGREPDEVDEDDGDDPPLVPGRALLADRGTAGEAEAGDRSVFLAAGRTDDHSKSLRLRAPKVARVRGGRADAVQWWIGVPPQKRAGRAPWKKYQMSSRGVT